MPYDLMSLDAFRVRLASGRYKSRRAARQAIGSADLVSSDRERARRLIEDYFSRPHSSASPAAPPEAAPANIEPSFSELDSALSDAIAGLARLQSVLRRTPVAIESIEPPAAAPTEEAPEEEPPVVFRMAEDPVRALELRETNAPTEKERREAREARLQVLELQKQGKFPKAG